MTEINRKKIITMRTVLITGTLLMIIKFLAYFITHSNGILTDAIESIVNVLAGMFALYSLHYASKPADEDHPYGHGKIEFMSSGVEGGMIFLAGVAMLVKGGFAFYHQPQLEKIDLGLGLTLISGFVNYLMARILIKKGKLNHSATMVADGKHLLTDTWSSAGLAIGLTVLYFTGWVWVDTVITLGLGLIIVYTGFELIKESVFNLLDKADYVKIKHLIELLNRERKSNWIDIHNLRIVKYGPLVHVDCHMTLPWYYNLEDAHREVDTLAKLATANLNYEIEFFIHADPCLPSSCSVCELNNCEVRKQAFVRRLDWNIGNVLPDAKHRADV